MSFLSGLFKRSYPLDLRGFTDYHCHILPGVDDGVETIEESLRILEAYEQAGIKEVWLTPHIMEDLPNATAFLRSRFDELVKCYGGPVEIRLAAENMIDNILLERLETNDLLPIGNAGNILLVETSYFNAPIGLSDTFKAIQANGFYPLLAHPERYNYIPDISEYKELKGKGIGFQLNLMSLGGCYGAAVQEKAEKLLAEGMYDCIGSDLHSLEHLDVMDNLKLPRQVLQNLRQIIQ